MEATVAVNFILSYLYNKLPRRRVDMFGEMLEQMLQSNLEGFWSSQFSKSKQLFVGSPMSYRYTFYCGLGVHQVDLLIGQVAAACLIDLYEILSYFPESLVLHIEPGKVQYSVSPSLAVVDIWKSDQRKYELLDLLKQGLVQPQVGETRIPDQEPLESINPGSIAYSSTFGWQKPTVDAGAIQKSSSTPNFTAATFAQTKFGSTKLKSQLKRSSRISTYLAQQRSLVAAISTMVVQEASVTTCSVSMATALHPSTTACSSSASLSPYFDSPTGTITQRSISLSPCVRPPRGHSPPFFTLPLILPPFASTTDPTTLLQFPSVATTTCQRGEHSSVTVVVTTTAADDH